MDKSSQSILKKLGASDLALFLTAFLKWLALGALVGIIVGLIGSGFAHTLSFVNALRGDHPWLLLGLPFGGLVIVFLYRFFKNTSDKGTNTVVASIQSSTEIPFKMAPLIFISTTAKLPHGTRFYLKCCSPH